MASNVPERIHVLLLLVLPSHSVQPRRGLRVHQVGEELALAGHAGHTIAGGNVLSSHDGDGGALWQSWISCCHTALAN